MQKKNEYVDFLRGLAILLVVLGHTLQNSVNRAESHFLFQVIWTLQMPLFFLISGYVTRYSRSHPSTLRELAVFIGRKTYAYLLPFVVWTFLIRGLLFGQSNLLDIPHLVYSMDSGYWFLFSLWTMTLFYGIAEYLAARLSRSRSIAQIALTVVFFTVGALALAALGLACSLSFLCIKLTLYYMPIYLFGYLFGQVQENLLLSAVGKVGIPVVTTVCAAIWLFFLLNFNMYAIADNLIGIILRYTASLTGCIALCGLLAGIFPSLHRAKKPIIFAGVHSLEIYVIHTLCLAPIRLDCEFLTIQGVLSITLNYAITLAVCYVCIRLLCGNPITRRLLFAKK